MNWGQRLLGRGGLLLQGLGPILDEVDPVGTIRPASRLLCAGLAELAGSVWSARAEGPPPARLLEAAALLALLTKLDDQVIDSRAFHGGAATDRSELARRTDAFLAPTLRSIRQGVPARDEPRCRLAGQLGAALRDLSPDPARLRPLLDVIAQGWAIQTEAVVLFTRWPCSLQERDVDRVTGAISGAWLLMIALVGALPEQTGAWPDADEQAAFYEWGLHIQRADALSDLEGDQTEGLVATSAGWQACRADPIRYREVAEGADPGGLHVLLVEHDVDLRLLPDRADLDRLDVRLAALGDLSGLLRWIHGFLLGRYLAGPFCRRDSAHPSFSPLLADWSSWQTAGGRSPCSEP
jgi:hypothetical protein